MYKTVPINRTYNGLASVRSYIVDECRDSGKGMKLVCNGAVLYIEHEDLDKGAVGSKKFTSKYDGRPYRLVDFRWQK